MLKAALNVSAEKLYKYRSVDGFFKALFKVLSSFPPKESNLPEDLGVHVSKFLSFREVVGCTLVSKSNDETTTLASSGP
jgi:hypothetical protein